jgi:uroporphyrinogen III methyltransferase / synthase
MKEGKVFLVGAGPGDPGLITVKGVKCLREAEVIIYDRLVDEEILKEASPQAEKIYVGKEASLHTLDQGAINGLLLERARQGKRVVRLKGGDPFVLGRGGEEAEILAKHRIPFDVVPGVSSACAVPAYAGIPVTYRGVASSFAVVTGHRAFDTGEPPINWDKISAGVDTLVILMGLKNLPNIVEGLLRAGREPSIPVAVISSGTSPKQRCVTGTLQDIVGKVDEERIKPPATIVIGEVVRLRRVLNWFQDQGVKGDLK